MTANPKKFKAVNSTITGRNLLSSCLFLILLFIPHPSPNAAHTSQPYSIPSAFSPALLP